MKFIVTVRHKSGGESWEEPYDKSGINSLEDAKEWSFATVDNFNATLRPHERARKVVSVRLADNSVSDEHDFHKTCLVTVNDPRLGLYDRMACRVCGVTGKRFGLGRNGVKIDSKYKAKKFQKCSTAKAARAAMEL